MSGAYLQNYGSDASRYVALGIYLVTAFLCLHLPLRLWRRCDAMSLRLFCLTTSLVIFWAAVRLAGSGRLGEAPLMKSALVFLIPVGMYALLSHFLLKWAEVEPAGNSVTGAAAPGQPGDLPNSDKHGNS